jgi:hypothetical protein
VKVESYSFGRVSIDGKSYDKDLILLHGNVISSWWRQAGGHVFAVEDLQQVIDAAPEVVVLGTGAYGLVRVKDELVEAFSQAGTRIVSARTGEAVERLNQLLDQDQDVAAALHLTC